MTQTTKRAVAWMIVSIAGLVAASCGLALAYAACAGGERAVLALPFPVFLLGSLSDLFFIASALSWACKTVCE